jgi:N-dimethylarginine dimethylaminohydrolase
VIDPLKRVLVRAPRPEEIPSWQALGWRAEPDPVKLTAEHAAFCQLLADAGAEVVTAHDEPGTLDSIYVFDPALVTGDGAVLLRPGKPERRNEPDVLAHDLALAGVRIRAHLVEPELAEGGDTLWLDEQTLLVGRSYRTTDAGIDALRRALPGVDVLAFDLPHLNGRGEVLHLLSLLSPLDRDLAVAYVPLLPVRLVELLEQRGIVLVAVPDDEFETMGANVLALGPRVGLAVAGNETTRRRLARAGVEVLVYRGDELSKGDGGPTCLTCPLVRG